MDVERSATIEALFARAEQLPPSRWDAFLEDATDDPQIRAAVRARLTSDDDPPARGLAMGLGSMIGSVAALWAEKLLDADRVGWIGRRVGSYEITGILGQGGMGAVYRARRADGHFEHEVAIKFVRQGLETPAALERFRQERQILARLAHPAIARLIDGGTVPDEFGGETPYLVMELVAGQPITTYCEANELSLRDRLTLFRRVCDAVLHAHQQLVVHRDLKPSNILITSEGQPKLLDFGIAKLLTDHPTQAASTSTGMQMLTPEYASPEQVRGEPITAATDVYSLGTILYELLTRQKAHRFNTQSPAEISRVICDAEATRPSVAVVQAAPNAARVSRQLRGDLDTIVLMALRKDPQRRYRSVEQVSDDVGRYLDGLPVRARADTLGYRSRKFVRRHRVAVAAGTLAIMTLAGGIIVTTREARGRAAEAARAERRFQQVRQLASTLLFEFHDTILEVPGATAAREMVVQTAQRYLRGLAAEAEGDPSLQMELAEAYRKIADVQFNARQASLGDAAAALESYTEALALTRALVAREPGRADYQRALAETYLGMGNTLTTSGDSAARLDAVRQGLRAAEAALALNPSDERATFTLIAAYDAFGTALIPTRELPAVLDNYRQGLTAAERLASRVSDVRVRQALARAHENVGEVLSQMGDLIPAVEHARQSVKLQEALVAESPNESSHRRNLMSAHTGLGDLLGSPVEFSLGQPAAAEAEYQKALAIGDMLAAADEKDAQVQLIVAAVRRKLGNVLATSNPRSAVDMHRRAIAVMAKLLESGPKNMTYRRQQALNYLWFAQPLHALRHDVAAFASVRRALAIQRDILAEDGTRQNVRQDMLATLNAMGDLQMDAGDAEAASGSYREALAIAESVVTAAPADEWARRDRLDCYERLGRFGVRYASRAGITPARRLQAWRQAREWHLKSLAGWSDWTRLSSSNVYVQRRHDQAAKAVAVCEAALGTLEPAAAATEEHRRTSK